MNYSCLSCRAKYVIPDRRVAAAGADGLRVRCSRCRAIMAVHADATTSIEDGDASTMPMSTGVSSNPFAAVGLDGAIDGVDAVRDVTGVFTPMLTASVDTSPEERSSRLFFAAVGGRSRGPFTAREMVMLAEKGKVRANTLVWKSGTPSWQSLRTVTTFDAAWLQDAVRRRKRREREAEKTSLQKAGITPILLERRTIRVVDAPNGAPSLPDDAIDADDELPIELVPATGRRLGWRIALGVAALLTIALTAASWAARAG